MARSKKNSFSLGRLFKDYPTYVLIALALIVWKGNWLLNQVGIYLKGDVDKAVANSNEVIYTTPDTTMSPSLALEYADRLFKALDGLYTDDAEVWRIYEVCAGDLSALAAINNAYGVRKLWVGLFWQRSYNLREALNSDLGRSDFEKWDSLFRKLEGR